MSALVIFCVFSLFNFIHHSAAMGYGSLDNNNPPCGDNCVTYNQPACSGNCDAYNKPACSGNCDAYNKRPCSGNCDAYNKPACSGNCDTYRSALVTFNNSVKYPPERLNWSESQHHCSWQGVTCGPDGFTIVYLQLPGKQLSGSIPPNSIGMLTSLRVLSLGYNNLFDPIPPDFSRLTYLTRLDLSNNNFSGNINLFSTLLYLTTLVLNNNSFSGNLPEINSKYLINFNVSYNKLNSRIPPSLSMFPVSAFSNNVYLCGRPLLAPCNSSYPAVEPTSNVEQDYSTGRRAIFGIYSGSMMALLILLSFLGKKMYQLIKPTSELMEKKKLVTFDEDGFDMEDLLKTTTAEFLGEGSFGTSYKQVFAGKEKPVVVKILKDVVVTEEEFKTTMEVLGKIKNNYVVPLRAFFNYSSHEKLLVYDYMSGGSLFARLHGSARTQLDWNDRMQIALNAAKGLTYLHEDEKIVHGNITSSNIFLQETSNEVSFSDYGLNKLFRGSRSLDRRITGYWAPEVLMTRDFTFNSDVYSYGVLLLELLTGKIPKGASLDKEGAHRSEWVESIVSEEQKDELFDVKLVRDHNINKMEQLLLIAKDCLLIVHDQRQPIHDVVTKIEDMLLRQPSDYISKGYNNKPSMETRYTPSTVTGDTH